MTTVLLSFPRVKSLQPSLTSLFFSHIPHQRVRLALPSKHIHGPITPHQLHCHHPDLSCHPLLPGLLLLPPNNFPSSIPCLSRVNSQNRRQSNNRFCYKSSQAYSPSARIFLWLFASFQMRAGDVTVTSGTMHPLAPKVSPDASSTTLPLAHSVPTGVFLKHTITSHLRIFAQAVLYLERSSPEWLYGSLSHLL